MASLRITEFAGVMQGIGGSVPVPEGPPLAHQVVTIGTEADSSALQAGTRLVRLRAEAACCVTWGPPEQTATTDMMLLGANDTEYIGVSPGDEISVITT